MIRVELLDGTFLRVAPKGLDLLIRHGHVKRFQRESGWIEVDKGPIRDRTDTDSAYFGPERRCPA